MKVIKFPTGRRPRAATPRVCAGTCQAPWYCTLVGQIKALEKSDPMLLLAIREVLEKGKRVDEADAGGSR
jgi:hypothetical protein